MDARIDCAKQRVRWPTFFVLAIGTAPCAWARGFDAAELTSSVWTWWSWEPGVISSLVLSAILYGVGLYKLRKTASRKRRQHEEIFFYGGWLALAVALVSPIHRWGGWLFSVHMVQHELLMVVAAPLIVLGRPGLLMLKGLPAKRARSLMAFFKMIGATELWFLVSSPLPAWILHAAALWCWHIPFLFEATFRSEWAHALQHASFFVTAIWFWHSVFRGPRRAQGFGVAVVVLFTTAIHSSVLGALLTFAPHAWYPSYNYTARYFGLTPLEDQQLGGLIMWIPAGLSYVLAALALFLAWMKQAKAAQPEHDRLWGIQSDAAVDG